MRIPCRTNPEKWFSTNPDKIREAVQGCNNCPIMDECRDMGRDEKHGVWGGWTEEDRAPRIAEIVAAEREAERLATRAEVLSLRKDGNSLRAIADLTGLSKSHVANHLNAA